MKTLLYGLFLSILVTSLSVFAATTTDIKIGEISYAGTGCPKDTLEASLSPESTVLSVLFSAASAQVGGTEKLKKIRQACSLRIPFQLPKNRGIKLVAVDYRGFASIPEGGSAKIHSQSTFVSGNWKFKNDWKTILNIKHEYSSDFDVHEDIKPSLGYEVFGCGKNAELDLQLIWDLHTNKAHDEALLELDSADFSTQSQPKHAVYYKFSYINCH